MAPSIKPPPSTKPCTPTKSSSSSSNIAKRVASTPAAASSRNESQQPQLSEKPKRSRNAYNFFFMSERQRMVQERDAQQPQDKLHGAALFSSMGKKVAARWKELTLEKKAPFQAMANQDKIRFQREREVYNRGVLTDHLRASGNHSRASEIEDGAVQAMIDRNTLEQQQPLAASARRPSPASEVNLSHGREDDRNVCAMRREDASNQVRTSSWTAFTEETRRTLPALPQALPGEHNSSNSSNILDASRLQHMLQIMQMLQQQQARTSMMPNQQQQHPFLVSFPPLPAPPVPQSPPPWLNWQQHFSALHMLADLQQVLNSTAVAAPSPALEQALISLLTQQQQQTVTAAAQGPQDMHSSRDDGGAGPI